jgi:hypothetical protein
MLVFRDRIRSLRTLLERTARFEDRLYLVDGDVRLTFGAHLDQVVRVAHALRERHGIRPATVSRSSRRTAGNGSSPSGRRRGSVRFPAS